MENADVARILSETADLLELTGGNPFKVRSYRQAAQAVDMLPEPVADIWRRGELKKLPGVGERMTQHIDDLLESGSFPEHAKLVAKVPEGITELLQLEGVGPKTVALAWKKLGVTEVAGLEAACRDGRLERLPRMGAKRTHAIEEAIERHRKRSGRMLLHRAMGHAESIVARLSKVPGVKRMETAGSLRRRRETVGDLDLLIASTRPDAAIKAFVELPEVAEVLAKGPTRSTVRLKGGLHVDLRVLRPSSFGAALHYFTGSKSHNIAVRTRAVRMGLKLSEYGVFDRKGHRLSGLREEDVFRAVGLPWIPPELREGTGEIEVAEKGDLPELIEEDDLVGDLHVHSDASSDGHSTLEELAAEAKRLGHRYLAITDHSKSRPLGLNAAGVLAHAERIRKLNQKLRGKPLLLAGIEVDILPDGSLDLPLEVLAKLDWVVASIHSHFRDSATRTTQRMIKAIRSGVIDVIGHPSGRLIGRRDPYQFDLPRVLKVAREEGVALEINASPDRLDLTDSACRLAKESGVQLVISSDAHHVSQLANLRLGVWVARRGWLEAGDVMNTTLAPLKRRAQRPERGVGLHA